VSEIALADVKASIRVFHNADDAQLERLITAAIREYLAFINHEAIPEIIDTEDLSSSSSSSSSTTTTDDFFSIPEDAVQGIIWSVQGKFEGDIEQQAKYREAAETLWQPYRKRMGV
jgi:hypothetical protein